MEKQYISIGIDCLIASKLKHRGLRTTSLPFDWCITYGGVSDIIKSRFKNYIPTDNTQLSLNANTWFYHSTFPNDYETFLRRSDRFLDLLNTTEKELVFIRNGHSIGHHNEAVKNGFILKNDIVDSEDLYNLLSREYPQLKFKVICFPRCKQCFELDTTTSDKITICNVTAFESNDDLFDREFNSVLEFA